MLAIVLGERKSLKEKKDEQSNLGRAVKIFLKATILLNINALYYPIFLLYGT